MINKNKKGLIKNKGDKMKRYYFNIKNANNEIIQKMNVVTTNLEAARNKVIFKVDLAYKNLATFLQVIFDYHEAVK